jgi:hypothetical protein
MSAFDWVRESPRYVACHFRVGAKHLIGLMATLGSVIDFVGGG